MNNSEWKIVKSIISEIIEAPEEEQKDLLDKAVSDNPSLSELLRTHYSSINNSEIFWDETIKGSSDLIQASLNLDEFGSIPVVEYKKGSRIGAYVLDEQIGKGGMGIVFKAHRADGQFERVVAIKLMALHIQFEEVQRRFEQEQKILASLNHPNIAQLYDAGVTIAGNPYLVMEYVEGDDIISYVSRNELGLSKRLQLFLDICEAVDFAHRNLVIHRDLKPENILVNKDGDLKVLDFGIAKLMNDSMDAVTESITQHQQRLYSLTYASAEQVLGHSINTSTDIYTVGLLLHELLTNSKYFNFEGVSRKEAEERILNQATNADHESEILLDKDLLAIRNKAIRVESDSRYNSIGELESDLRRFLNNEPVLARKGTTIYRASKFWKRNKGAVSTAAVFFIAAISFFVFYTVRISNERTIAEREAEKAQLVTDYLIGLFEQADPTGAQGKDQTVADFIQQSIDDLSGLDDNPVLQQEAIHTLAKVSLALGNIADAEILFNQALSLAKSNDSDPITLAIIFYDLGVLKETAGHYRDALSNFESAEILLEDVVSKDYGLRLSIIRSIATSHAHFGNVEQAETLLESVFNSLRTDDESVNNQRIQLLTDLADIVRESENYEASVQFDSEALSLLEVFQSENAELRIFIQNNLGYALKQLNRLDEALYYYNATLVGAEELYGTTHPRVLTTLGNISTLHVSRNDLDLSAEIDREILNRTVSAYGENHWRTGSAYGGLATALSNLRDSEAIEKIDISVSIFQDVLGYDHFWTLRQQLRQALIWYKFDKISEADALTEATVNRLTDTIQRPLAYYDKLGLERLQDLFVDAEYELGVENISEFFSWYASTIETEN